MVSWECIIYADNKRSTERGRLYVKAPDRKRALEWVINRSPYKWARTGKAYDVREWAWQDDRDFRFGSVTIGPMPGVLDQSLSF